MNLAWKKLCKYLIRCQIQEDMTTVMENFINLQQCSINKILNEKTLQIKHKRITKCNLK